ncbi:uncharacterized protein C21orf62 [Erpetoichthys calabaricus]|uniref:uncharacterized protein C21orf62 n=1 Tax=Erpetoichthys calabaricus TaxID=27687 RepID=UPI0022349086|nr:uncharacterized protein C21orf62 [Erpetoichthys calabaricus]
MAFFLFGWPLLIAPSLCLLLTPLATARSPNNTLLYHRLESSIRNCSCATEIEPCDYAKANILCNCQTVILRSADSLSLRYSYHGGLTVWMEDPWVLSQLVNYSVVTDLRLASCRPGMLSKDYLTVFGLQRLQVYKRAEHEVAFSKQDITIDCSEMPLAQFETPSVPHRVSFLDLNLLSGDSFLKAYSVSDVPAIKEHFPNLLFPSAFEPTSSWQYQVTFIY